MDVGRTPWTAADDVQGVANDKEDGKGQRSRVAAQRSCVTEVRGVEDEAGASSAGCGHVEAHGCGLLIIGVTAIESNN